jgi:hypothetical protein
VPHNPEWEELVREERWDWLEGIAASYGLTPEEYETAVNAHLKELLEGLEPWKRVHQRDLLSALQDNKFKNQFETGASDGLYDPDRRRDVEGALWGIPDDAGTDDRPKYGYLHSHPDGFFPGVDDDMSQYGGALVRFKSSLLDRATFTGGDTLDETNAGRWRTIAPARPKDARWTSLSDKIGDPLEIRSGAELVEVAEEFAWYVEAQYHGLVTLDDVAEVVFRSRLPLSELEHALRAAGVGYRLVE